MLVNRRTVVIPDVGYGPEPNGSDDVSLMAASRVQMVLPPTWTVEMNTEVAGLDSATRTPLPARRSFSLTHGGQVVATYLVEVKRTLSSSGLTPAIDKLLAYQTADLTGSLVMLMARYLSPPQRRTLLGRGIAFADATGNLSLTSMEPLILISGRGADADPWRGPGRPTTSLKGLPAARLVRALADFCPPYSVANLATLAGTSLGAAYRLSDYLVDEGLVTRAERGPITDVDWPELLRRWSQEASFLEMHTTHSYLEPRGIDNLVAKLGRRATSHTYAVSGSLAAQPYAPYAEARLALIYASNPRGIAEDLDLRAVETGANVILASPRSPVVFERTSMWRDVTVVAPSQAAADLLSGPGRNPPEGEYLIDWMKENPDAWRRQPDR